jgi:hypothetical protein
MKKQNEKSGFQTHIAEPRWQQVISVVVVIIVAAFFIWLAFIHHK